MKIVWMGAILVLALVLGAPMSQALGVPVITSQALSVPVQNYDVRYHAGQRAQYNSPALARRRTPVPVKDLATALKYRDIGAAKRLLRQGASANEVIQHDGSSLLHMAALYGYLDFVQLLLTYGADVQHRNNHQEQALHYAAMGGASLVVHALLEAGAEVDVRDTWQKTPLHKAAWRGAAAALKVLLEKGADVNARYKFQYTALHEAARKGHLAAVQVLVEAGADRSLKTTFKRTALDLALEQQNKRDPEKRFEAIARYLRALD